MMSLQESLNPTKCPPPNPVQKMSLVASKNNFPLLFPLCQGEGKETGAETLTFRWYSWIQSHYVLNTVGLHFFLKIYYLHIPYSTFNKCCCFCDLCPKYDEHKLFLGLGLGPTISST